METRMNNGYKATPAKCPLDFSAYQAVIFDMDGTLLDSMWMWLQIDIDFLAKHGHELPVDLQKCIEGKSFTETAQYFIERFGLEATVDELKSEWTGMAEEYYLTRVHLKQKGHKLLRTLKDLGIPMGIATSNGRILAEKTLEANQIVHYFDSIRTSCEVERGKPHPDVYLKVAEDLGVNPSKCLAFEDTEAGVDSALAAGMTVVAIYDESSKAYTDELKEKAHFYIDGFADLFPKGEQLPTVRKGDLIETVIEDMHFPTTGIGFYEDMPVRVKGGFIGETVRLRVKNRRDNRIEGIFQEVVEASTLSRVAPCKDYGLCGGCQMQHIRYEAQLEMKVNMVKRLFTHAGIADYTFDGIVPSPLENRYRNKMEYAFGNLVKDGPMTVGLHRKHRTFDIMDTEACWLVHEDFNRIVRHAKDYAERKGLPHYNVKTHEGFLRNLVVRRADCSGDLLIGLSVSSQVDHDFADYVEELLALSSENKCDGHIDGQDDMRAEYINRLEGRVVGILRINNDKKADTVQGDIDILHGQDFLVEKLMGLEFKVSFYSFFQTNPQGAEKLYERAMEYTGDVSGGVVYDLFSGTGTIGQIASLTADKAIGVELIEDAVKAANENAARNNLTHAEFIAGDVFEVLDRMGHELPKPDHIIVDPPRPGIMAPTFDKILAYDVPQITYVSCNPKSLVDNLVQAEKQGYKVTRMSLVDMYPHTHHVECVVKLERN